MGQRLRYLLVGTLLTLLLQVSAAFLGPMGMLFNLFVPLPAAYAGLRQGTEVAGGIVLLTLATLFGISGIGGMVAYTLQFGLGSCLLVMFLRKKIAWDRALALSILITGVFAGAALVGFSAQQNASVGSLVKQYVQEETGRAMSLYRQAGMEAEQLHELEGIVEQIFAFILHAWPGLAIMATGAVLLLTIYLLSALAKGHYQIPGPPFQRWKTPDHLVWLLILAGAGQLLADGLPQQIALNLLLVILPLYFLQGMAIVHFHFNRKKISPFFRNLSYLLITILNPLPLVVTGIGVFDLWVDFRKPRNKSNSDP